MELAGAVAVVTGATGSMGPKIVARLAELGAIPVAWDVYVEDGAERTIQCDVGDAASVEAAMEATVEGWGIPTVLVTVAALSGGFSPLATKATGDEWDRVLTSQADWTRVLSVNIIGVANCMRSFAKRLAEAGRPGSIVNISSISSYGQCEPGLVAYSASKAGLNQLTRVAAAELGPLGIRVNAVAPGLMADPMIGPNRGTAAAKPSDARPTEFASAIKKYVPIEQRHGTGEDLAQAVTAVLEMDWVTGQIIVADGGLTLRSPVTT